ncbi:MAG TPA: hypothetical protein PK760_10275 [Flavobacteriales bacterium]|nr:hypothetical protein [Flavobacteriales bacterium]
MEHTKLSFLAAALLFLNLSGACAASPPANGANQAVELTGWLHVQDYTMADVVVEMEVDGSIQRTGVKENGRFDLVLPANTEILLRFTKPGHLSKEVVVHTHSSGVGEPGQHKRRVEFAVILELKRWMGGLVYPGPVGNIGFDEGGGCLAVGHDKMMVPAKRNDPMTF